MKTTGFAKEHIMEEYLGVLLDKEDDNVEAPDERVAKLLDNVPQTVSTPSIAPEKAILPVENEQPRVKQASELRSSNTKVPPRASHEQESDAPFQALFFKVSGLVLAVPLIDLGGIHQMGRVGPLFGKPEWFSGVMLHREEKLNVVDTARWVMPDKYSDAMAQQLEYKYVVTLGKSEWGLSCESLVDTMDLRVDEIKWRQSRGTRPWLAGTVKEKMCALIDVAEMIRLLDQGLDINNT